jgi:hypothetical protein
MILISYYFKNHKTDKGYLIYQIEYKKNILQSILLSLILFNLCINDLINILEQNTFEIFA